MSDDRHKFIFTNPQIHMIQCPDFIFPGIINLARIIYIIQFLSIPVTNFFCSLSAVNIYNRFIL